MKIFKLTKFLLISTMLLSMNLIQALENEYRSCDPITNEADNDFGKKGEKLNFWIASEGKTGLVLTNFGWADKPVKRTTSGRISHVYGILGDDETSWSFTSVNTFGLDIKKGDSVIKNFGCDRTEGEEFNKEYLDLFAKRFASLQDEAKREGKVETEREACLVHPGDCKKLGKDKKSHVVLCNQPNCPVHDTKKTQVYERPDDSDIEEQDVPTSDLTKKPSKSILKPAPTLRPQE